MSEPRDPLLDAIHAAGEVPAPPNRDAAFARAMRPLLMPARRRLNRSVIALFAVALLAIPAAVWAERATHTPPATIAPITFEKPDPGSSIQSEADDATLKRQSATDSQKQSGSATVTEDRSGSTGSGTNEPDHSGHGGTPAPDDHSGPGRNGSGSGSQGPGGGDDTLSTPAPTPMPSATMGSPDGGLPDGSPNGGTAGPH